MRGVFGTNRRVHVRGTLSTNTARKLQAAVAIAVLTISTGSAFATPFAWDPGLTPGGSPAVPTGSGGSGTWDNGVTANWSNSAADTTWTDVVSTPVDTSLFGGTAGTVTLANTTMKSLGLTFTTTGYSIGAVGSTNQLIIGNTGITSPAFIDTSALSGGSVTFNAPIGLACVNNSTTLNQQWNVGTTSLTFNGLQDVGVSTFNLVINGASTITLNTSASGAMGLTGSAALVLSNTASSRNWNILPGATPGANMIVNGKITGSPTNSNNGIFTFQTGGTLTLTDATSDFAVVTANAGIQIVGGSTLSLGVGNGAAGIGVLGQRTNLLVLGANSSTSTTGATVKFTAPLTLDNPFKTSGNSTVPIVLTTNSKVILNGAFSNQVSQGWVTVNSTDAAGLIEFAGAVNTSNNTSSRTLTYLGNGPILVSGSVNDGGGSTNGRLTYAGTSTLTINGPMNNTGVTTVNSGTLILNGNATVATNNFTASGTGTLGGSGTIVGGVTVSGTGTLAPGSSIGTLTAGSLTLGGTSVSSFEINHTLGSNANDRFVTAGSIGFLGTLNVSDIGVGAVVTTVFDLFDFSGLTGTFNTVNLPAPPNGYAWHDYGGGVFFDYTTGSIALDAVVAPGLLGDVNGDHVVDQLDLNLVNSHWQQVGAGLALGDANQDGVVDQLDLNLVNSHWQQTSSPRGGLAVVPEPTSIGLLGVGSLAALARRRRRVS